MKQSRKIYDVVFKRKAVELSQERSSISELSRELGIRVSLLYKWRKEQKKLEIFEYIEIWYNKKKRHSILNYMNIQEFNNQIKKYKNVA